MNAIEGGETRRFAFLLIEKFSMIAFASAIEPLRVANRMARRELYAWSVVAEDGRCATCSNGTRVMADSGFAELDRGAMIIVCGGVDVNRMATPGVLAWLRKEARRGVALGAVCTGAHVLAKAGLLDGVRCTIHWENRDSFREEFPDLMLSNRYFERDGARWTSSGGAAAADMMVHMINEEQGRELAAMVVDQLALTPLRTAADEQRLSIPARVGVRHPKLTAVIHRMEENIEEPISPVLLSAEAGMSTRQLERLFRRYVDRSPKRYYMELRLRKARSLLLQTDMSVINVALACGFTSPSHFSKCYRNYFDRTPYRERGVAETAVKPL
ncbi:GlxA family transcriptional regulator [Pikeienuella sp. HZG-20]|uniref:GlxA family transcriptional regulator n=1 Tax=Paludibacillus litoralis TaxID=3133267 RepID=UPI0030EC080B